jgi:histidyl-tRNA synthetase
MATHGLQKLKRFQIGKVYRRDQPNSKCGRYREFYQCDFDIAGPSLPMLADAEVLKVFHELL